MALQGIPETEKCYYYCMDTSSPEALEPSNAHRLLRRYELMEIAGFAGGAALFIVSNGNGLLGAAGVGLAVVSGVAWTETTPGQPLGDHLLHRALGKTDSGPESND